MTISLQDLAKHFGARALFEGVSLQLNSGSRYGLIGANGSGKTTLLRILAGDEPASGGQVTIPREARCGVLRQDHFLRDEDAIIDIAMQGDAPCWELLQRQSTLSDDSSLSPQQIADLDEQIARLGGYTLKSRASAILQGLGIPEARLGEPLANLSGGFKLRVLLAQVLLGGPDVLLLDEPTNHLDILSIRWLELFLANYSGCAVVISHDRRFLDRISSHTLDVDYGTVTLYTGGCSAALAEKAANRTRKEAEIERAKAAIAEKRAFVERFGAKATKASQAQSRLKQIERIEVETLESTSRRAPRFRFEQLRPSGKDVLTVEGLRKSYGANHVLRDVGLLLRRGERLAVIGANGLGKSTLLEVAVGKRQADAGVARWGHETRVGFFPQNHRELLTDPEQKVIDAVWDLIPTETTSFVRGQLGRLLFSGEDVEKRVGMLSGGEAARLVFCQLMVKKPNVLVLDEPTNHLDLESIEALVEALQTYEGTLLFVSHDRWFLSRLATRILEVKAAGFTDFPGSFEEYLARSGEDHLDADQVVLKARQERSASSPPRGDSTYEEQRRRANRLKALPRKRDEVLAEIERLEARRASIEATWCEPGYFERTARDEIDGLRAEDRQLETAIASAMDQWEELEAELAAG